MTARAILILTCISGAGAAPIRAEDAAAKSAATVKSLQLHFASDVGEPVRELRLKGDDSRQQLLVTAECDDGTLRDFTDRTHYEASPPDVVRVEQGGVVRPIADGSAT